MILAYHVPPLVRWQGPKLGKQRSDPDQKNWSGWIFVRPSLGLGQNVVYPTLAGTMISLVLAQEQFRFLSQEQFRKI